MKVKCQYCKTEWDDRELRHHPASQEWVGGDLVACPYCIDEQQAYTAAFTLAMMEAVRRTAGRARK